MHWKHRLRAQPSGRRISDSAVNGTRPETGGRCAASLQQCPRQYVISHELRGLRGLAAAYAARRCISLPTLRARDGKAGLSSGDTGPPGSSCRPRRAPSGVPFGGP